MRDKDRLEMIRTKVGKANRNNLGDILKESLQDYLKITEPDMRMIAEERLSKLRFMASGADVGWRLFGSPLMPDGSPSDIEVLQLVGIERALHEMSYAFEMVEKSAEEGWGGSSKTRFYLNSLYHYISSLFLIDTSKKTHRGLPMGGTIIRALHPLRLSKILEPVNVVLKRTFGEKFTFGEAILMQRHSFLVHGTFSPENVECLVSDTQMRDLSQQLVFREHMWDLFYHVVLLRLRVLSVLTKLNIKFDEIASRYSSSSSKI